MTTAQRLRCVRIDGEPTPMFDENGVYEAFIGDQTTCVIDKLGHQRVLVNETMRFNGRIHFMLEVDTPLVTVSQQALKHVAVNYAAVQQEVNRYLEAQPICGTRYICDRVTTGEPAELLIHLSNRYTQEVPDEDFSSDVAFDLFCDRMAARLMGYRIGVPVWYYGQ